MIPIMYICCFLPQSHEHTYKGMQVPSSALGNRYLSMTKRTEKSDKTIPVLCARESEGAVQNHVTMTEVNHKSHNNSKRMQQPQQHGIHMGRSSQPRWYCILHIIIYYIFRDNDKAPPPTSKNLHGFTRGLNIYIYICIYIYIAYRLPLMPICSAIMDMGPGPGPRAQKLRAPRPRPSSFWALGPGPGPISIMAEHMGIKGNQ